MDFLQELNAVQKNAVKDIKASSLVIAGAGSGKTRVLTYKIAYLLKSNFKSYRILALTFTNKAAKEMKNRVVKLVGEDIVKDLWMGTFHSIFAKILRFEAEKINFPKDFTIYDNQDSKNLLKEIIKNLRLDPEIYKPNDVLSRISSAKNNLITAKFYANSHELLERDKMSRRPEISKIYSIYTNRCFSSGAMDYDDLLLQMNILFKNNDDILKKYQKRFDFILVDEYQDTNYSQYLIIKKLSAIHKKICVVGDDSQSIYSFRGARIENILNFKNDFPNYNLYKLERNYRSTQNIVNLSNEIIKKNRIKIKKKVFSKNEIGSKIKVVKCFNDGEEANLTVANILEIKNLEKFNYSDFAILYRTNAQSRIFEEALRKGKIPYKIFGGLSFYQRKEIKDIIAYCRFLVNKKDTEALLRIINYPKRAIGNTTVSKIVEFSNSKNISVWKIIFNIEKVNFLNSRAKNSIKKFYKLIELLSIESKKKDAYEIIKLIVSKTGILNELKKNTTIEGISRYENLEELLSAIKNFTMDEDEEDISLSSFLQKIAVLTDIEKDDGKNDFLSLMTVHASKGLEFKNIFLVGMEENLFPSGMSISSQSKIEEERRLFYVGVTRAEKNLIISYTNLRYRFGEFMDAKKSRFIDEMDSRFIYFVGEKVEVEKNIYNFPKNKRPKKDFFQEKLQNLRKITNDKVNFENEDHSSEFKINYNLVIGQNVEHQRFGFGKILHIEGVFPNKRAKILFRKDGEKILLLKFAKFRDNNLN